MIYPLEEGNPIYDAINSGGGQTCDINGVVMGLYAAGYTIVPMSAIDEARSVYGHPNENNV